MAAAAIFGGVLARIGFGSAGVVGVTLGLAGVVAALLGAGSLAASLWGRYAGMPWHFTP